MAHEDKEKKNARDRIYHHTNRAKESARNRVYHQAHPGEHANRMRAYDQVVKAEALRVLGSKCACPGCDESEPIFLTIDHIYGRPKGPRKDALHEARRSGWDKTKFQILCYNCNCTKRDCGFCPVHQQDPGQRNGHNPVVKLEIDVLKVPLDRYIKGGRKLQDAYMAWRGHVGIPA